MFLRTLWELLDLGDLRSRFLPKLLKNLRGCSQRTLVKVLPSATNDGSGIHSQQLLENSKDTQTVPGHLREGFSRLRRARRTPPYPAHQRSESVPPGLNPGGPNRQIRSIRSSPKVIAPHLHLIRDCISPEIVSRAPRSYLGTVKQRGESTGWSLQTLTQTSAQL